jgi:hypothetical protein
MAGNTSVFTFTGMAVSYDGIPIGGFFHGDDVIKISYETPLVQMVNGVDGGGTFNLSGINAVRIEIKLLSSSTSNTTLSAFYGALRAGIITPGLLHIEDVNGLSEFTGDAVLEGFPNDSQFGEKDSGRTWVFLCINPLLVPGQVGSTAL